MQILLYVWLLLQHVKGQRKIYFDFSNYSKLNTIEKGHFLALGIKEINVQLLSNNPCNSVTTSKIARTCVCQKWWWQNMPLKAWHCVYFYFPVTVPNASLCLIISDSMKRKWLMPCLPLMLNQYSLQVIEIVRNQYWGGGCVQKIAKGILLCNHSSCFF